MKTTKKITDFYDLPGARTAVIVVNMVTLYRIVTVPFLFYFLYHGYTGIFKWMLLLSFSTDAVDGFIARRYKAESILGAVLDSIGDDLTIFMAITGAFILRHDFVMQEMVIIAFLFCLFLIQLAAALIRYRRMSSFHTYGAKIAAVLQGLFLLSLFFFEEQIYWLFYITSVITAAELIEEIILVFLIPEWTVNVKGIYWLMKRKKFQTAEKDVRK